MAFVKALIAVLVLFAVGFGVLAVIGAGLEPQVTTVERPVPDDVLER